MLSSLDTEHVCSILIFLQKWACILIVNLVWCGGVPGYCLHIGCLYAHRVFVCTQGVCLHTGCIFVGTQCIYLQHQYSLINLKQGDKLTIQVIGVTPSTSHQHRPQQPHVGVIRANHALVQPQLGRGFCWQGPGRFRDLGMWERSHVLHGTPVSITADPPQTTCHVHTALLFGATSKLALSAFNTANPSMAMLAGTSRAL